MSLRKFNIGKISITICLVSLFVFALGGFLQAQNKSFLRQGEMLKTGQYLVSENNKFFAVMQDNAKFCVYDGTGPADPNKVCLWCSDNKLQAGNNFFAIMQSDSNFCVYKGTGPKDPNKVFLWGTNKLQVGENFFALMQDDKNFCVYKGTGPTDPNKTDLWCAYPYQDSPITIDFSSTTGWKTHGNASINTDKRRLELTTASLWQRGLAVYDDVFNANYGLTVEFDYSAGGGTGADGIAFFLVDGTTNPVTMGGAGACLGYGSNCGQNLSNVKSNGIPNAYLGVGLDECGNFANNLAACDKTGPGMMPQSVTIRGSGNGKTGYKYLTHESVGSQGGISGDGRRARITLTPDAHLTVEMSWDKGVKWHTVIDDFNVNADGQVALPETFKLGFSGATGGLTNNHYVDNLVIHAKKSK